MTPLELKLRNTICDMLGMPPEATSDEMRAARKMIEAISGMAPDKETVAATLAAVDLLIETAVDNG